MEPRLCYGATVDDVETPLVVTVCDDDRKRGALTSGELGLIYLRVTIVEPPLGSTKDVAIRAIV